MLHSTQLLADDRGLETVEYDHHREHIVVVV
jgi:hypothetical protein